MHKCMCLFKIKLCMQNIFCHVQSQCKINKQNENNVFGWLLFLVLFLSVIRRILLFLTCILYITFLTRKTYLLYVVLRTFFELFETMIYNT